MIRLLVVAAAVALASPAAGGSPSVLARQLVERARQTCAGFEHRRFSGGERAIAEVDLTGDGMPEEIVDESAYRCSTAASLYCGSGGCMVRIVAHGKVFERLAKAWRIVEWGKSRIVLFALHGTACAGSGFQPCYEAVVWGGGHFLSVRPPAKAR